MKELRNPAITESEPRVEGSGGLPVLRLFPDPGRCSPWLVSAALGTTAGACFSWVPWDCWGCSGGRG